MNFESSTEVTILFDAWHTDTSWKYALSLLGLLLISFFNQYLVFLTRRCNARRTAPQLTKDPTAPFYAEQGSEFDTLLSNNNTVLSRTEQGYLRARVENANRTRGSVLLLFALEVLFFTLALSVGYLMMLAAMTENVGVFFAVVVGEASGVVIFTQVLSPSREAIC